MKRLNPKEFKLRLHSYIEIFDSKSNSLLITVYKYP